MKTSLVATARNRNQRERLEGSQEATATVQVRDVEGLAQGSGNTGAGRALKDTGEVELAECSGGLDEWGEKLRYDVRISSTDVWQLMSEHRLEKGW